VRLTVAAKELVCNRKKQTILLLPSSLLSIRYDDFVFLCVIAVRSLMPTLCIKNYTYIVSHYLAYILFKVMKEQTSNLLLTVNSKVFPDDNLKSKKKKKKHNTNQQIMYRLVRFSFFFPFAKSIYAYTERPYRIPGKIGATEKIN
jgi:hypothetical protein